MTFSIMNKILPIFSSYVKEGTMNQLTYASDCSYTCFILAFATYL